ncbi:hypothetical protein I4U23_013864 [Adineta vaga]|nr:hypothetical protein I4U23_013864 [Adineta vaga]
MSLELNSTNPDDEQEESKSSTVILFLSFSILAACVCKVIFSKCLKNKFPIPFTVAVLLLGLIIGIIVNQIDEADNDFLLGVIQLSELNPHLLYYIFLPLLIFDSSFNGHFHLIKQQLYSAILLAGPGVFISTASIALCVVYIYPYQWSWLVGLLFGGIMSATDTVAVLALLHDAGASKSLSSLIDSESLLNDGSAFVIFLTFYNIVTGRNTSAKAIVIDIVKYSIGGPLFGLACGIVSVIILNRIYNELEVQITCTFGLAYMVFYLADVELDVSAVLAIVTMGLYMCKYKYCISSHVQSAMASAWRLTTYFINILIFAITGLLLAKSFFGTKSTITLKDFGFSIVLYIIIHIGRIITLIVLYPFIKRTGVHISWKDGIILTWTGLRGSMALILVLIVSLDTKIDLVTRNRFLFHTSMIVLLTLIINGTSSKYLVRLLGLHRGTKESEIVLLQALEHMRRQTSWKLSQMKKDEKFADVDWNMLNEYLPEKLLEELDEKNNTTFHRQLSVLIERQSTSIVNKNGSTDHELQTIPVIYQTNSIPNTPLMQRKISEEHDRNIRNELTIRFLTAMSIDYEKQWYLGMIRRKTLNILIKSVEQAKQKCSFRLHWKSIAKHFRLPYFLQYLIKHRNFSFMNRFTDRLLFDHIYQTIELTLSFHSAKTRLDNIRLQFPELSNINEHIMMEVCDEVEMYQLNALHTLLDLQRSYPFCWTTQMTRRCAQMLLKYESVAIIQLYETELIEKKLYILENENIKVVKNQTKKLKKSFDLIPYFQSLSSTDKIKWQLYLTRGHRWFQPGTILIEKHQRVSIAYLVVRGIVQCKDDSKSTYYNCGSIIGIELLFSKTTSSHRVYTAHDSLVEVYEIDSIILDTLLSDKLISRSIYNEIALHIIMNHYQTSLNLTHSQLQMLLNEKATFYQNQSVLLINFEAKQRLCLISGTMQESSNQRNSISDSVHFIIIDSPRTYNFDSSSILYTWTIDDEVYCSNTKKFKISFSDEATLLKNVEPFYPLYSGQCIEFSPHRQSMAIVRPIENTSHLHLIPSEIEVMNEQHVPAEFSKL